MKVYSFEKLKVWNDAINLTTEIYALTKSFPDSEKFGLISQIRRASVSVCLNISEGSARWSTKEKARFYEIGYGSLMEVLSCLILSHKLGFINHDTLIEFRIKIEPISSMITALYKNPQ